MMTRFGVRLTTWNKEFHRKLFERNPRYLAIERGIPKRKARGRDVRQHRRFIWLVNILRTTREVFAAPILGDKGVAKAIIYETARSHDFMPADILSENRNSKLVAARQEAVYKIIEKTELSLNQIGKLINRDHTTILHSVRAHARRFDLPIPRYADVAA